jgi:hypothetical protein
MECKLKRNREDYPVNQETVPIHFGTMHHFGSTFLGSAACSDALFLIGWS